MLPSSKVMKSAERVVVNVLLFSINGTSLERYAFPDPMREDVPQTLEPRMSWQSFGVSHMKLGAGAVALLRSLTRTQSVRLPQLLGFAKNILLHLAVLLVMSWKAMNGLWITVYGS